MPKPTQSLRAHLISRLSAYPNVYRMAQDLGLSHGLVCYVLQDESHDSPTLRKQLRLPKHPPRVRLNIDCDAAVIARFDTQRGDMSRGEYLERLLSLEWRL